MIDFTVTHPMKEVIHEAKLFFEPQNRRVPAIELFPTGEGALYHAGGQELGQQIESFVAQNPPFSPVILEARGSQRVKIPSYSRLDPRLLHKEDRTANVLVSLRIGTNWMFLLVRTGFAGVTMSQIHKEIRWRKNCAGNTPREVLDSFEREESNFGSSAEGLSHFDLIPGD